MIVTSCIPSTGKCDVIATKHYDDIYQCTTEALSLASDLFKLSDKTVEVNIKCQKVSGLET